MSATSTNIANTFKKARRKAFVAMRSFGLHNQSNFFVQNLAVLIEAGMSITQALDSVYREVSSFRMRSALREVINNVDNGWPLSKALDEARLVSSHTLSLIELGERSGNLSQNLRVAALQNEKETVFRSRVRSALAYSSFVFVTAIVVGIGVAWYVLPKIATFFTDLNAPLPRITRILIDGGIFLQTYGYIFVPAFLVVLLILFYFLFSFPKTRFIGHTILFRIPVIKSLILETEVARFGFLSGTMIKAGMPIALVFELLPKTTTFGNYRALYTVISARILEGLTFQKIFRDTPRAMKLLPASVRQMIIAAEQSGALSDTLVKVGAMYEEKVEATSRNIPAFLEPTLLIVIGIIVAVLSLGILMPVYQLGLYF
jgi:type IV pilus assembly protein PilC